MDSLLQNRKLLLGVLGMFALLGIAAGIFVNRQDQKESEAKNALYAAQKEMATEARALQTTAPKNPAEAGAVDFKRISVSEKLPRTVAALQSVTTKYPGSRSSHEAEVLLGSLYLKHGDAQVAQGWFEQAASSARGAFEKSVAYLNLGSVQEGQSRFKEALESYEKGASQGETATYGELH